MNITDMAAALPVGRKLDFLLFDACFMGSVEALYDLRNNAKQIIASPTEVMGNGFPYHQILPLLFAANIDAAKVAQVYVDSYRGTTYPSASVGVINTSELEALATTVKDLMAAHPDYSSLDLSAIQAFELRKNHLYYDLDDYLAQLSGEDLYYQAFQEQLSKTVTYVDYTPTIYSAYGEPAGDFFALTHCCGLSSFIPQADPQYAEEYWNTNWAKAITSQSTQP